MLPVSAHGAHLDAVHAFAVGGEHVGDDHELVAGLHPAGVPQHVEGAGEGFFRVAEDADEVGLDGADDTQLAQRGDVVGEREDGCADV